MADGAHEASGPASSGPAGIARQAERAASSDRGKLRVFISYSREDLDFADQLAAALDSSGFECFIDREGISGGEAWKRRLGDLISEADTVIFVLSPSSARSETCNWEVEEAARLNKRILPANWRPLEGVSGMLSVYDLREVTQPMTELVGRACAKERALSPRFMWMESAADPLIREVWDPEGIARSVCEE